MQQQHYNPEIHEQFHQCIKVQMATFPPKRNKSEGNPTDLFSGNVQANVKNAWRAPAVCKQMNKVHETSTKHSKHCDMLLAGCNSNSKPSIQWYGARATGRHLTSQWK